MSLELEVARSLKKAVEDLSAEEARAAAQEAIRIGMDPVEAIQKGLSRGVQEVGEKFARGEAFIAELILAGEAMQAGIEVLKPIISEKKISRKGLGKVVIGTVRGDIHDIGKNIVCLMLTAAGFDVIDLGVDVAPEIFVRKAKESKAQFIAMSALLTVSIPEQRDTLDALKKEGIRKNIRVVVGGAAMTAELAHQMGADGYSDNAADAVDVFKKLVTH